MVFDDSYEHEVWHEPAADGQVEVRIILSRHHELARWKELGPMLVHEGRDQRVGVNDTDVLVA